jgi:TetR/AcrR family transcriptional regulator, regulator of cefoperazone and chloramphenicol sensitivity
MASRSVGVVVKVGADSETRARVLSVATRLFAANGFQKVTVREICGDAEANVAAVNYHFGDKLGLYREVLGGAIEAMRQTTEIARRDGEGRSAEERLRIYIHTFMDRVVKHGRDSWIHQLMVHEMADPTPALELVIDQVIRPRIEYVNSIVADLLGVAVDDPRVARCSMSVHSQFQFVMKNPVTQRLMPEFGDTLAPDALAEHIVKFSLAGIRALRG